MRQSRVVEACKLKLERETLALFFFFYLARVDAIGFDVLLAGLQRVMREILKHVMDTKEFELLEW